MIALPLQNIYVRAYEIENKNTFISLVSLVNTKFNTRYDLEKPKPRTKFGFD